jgi:DNA-binding beta-propeller fold protein YncE
LLARVLVGIAFDSANGDLYVTNVCNSAVSVISGQTNTIIGNPIPIDNPAGSIAFDSANGDLYVVKSGMVTAGGFFHFVLNLPMLITFPWVSLRPNVGHI